MTDLDIDAIEERVDEIRNDFLDERPIAVSPVPELINTMNVLIAEVRRLRSKLALRGLVHEAEDLGIYDK